MVFVLESVHSRIGLSTECGAKVIRLFEIITACI